METEIGMDEIRSLCERLAAMATTDPLRATSSVLEQCNVTKKLISSKSSHTPETKEEIDKLKSALAFMSPDVDRGNGSFFEKHSGKPAKDYWLGVIWAIRSLGWTCGEQIARAWSEQAKSRYTDAGFTAAWEGYDPQRLDPVGIGSLYKFSRALGWQYLPDKTVSNDSYRLLSARELMKLPAIDWRVRGVFPAQGLGCIYGPSASGKSFIALDMAVSIAHGDQWFGLRTKATNVVYVALEGEGGYKNRVAAWEKARGRSIPSKLSFVLQSFKINDERDVLNLAEAVQPESVVIIDTLNRAAPTADENSSRDMGEILEGAKRLQRLTSGLVIFVHHTGKDTSKGARGHSSLFAALDGAIQVERKDDVRSWCVSKSKDGVDSTIFPFELKIEHLGFDGDGEAVTSCVVERDFTAVFKKTEPKGKNQQPALRLIKAAINSSTVVNKAGSGSQTKCARLDQIVIQVAQTVFSTEEAKKRLNRARTLINDLINAGHLHSGFEGDEVWVWD